ncbi:hypothetical protein NEFER03_1049 [Nematocida sp. LUAm3]|nr:hypothetical protein NEFER03_1049 [Nematocida sp. LUAm3]KAI5175346.1 hypothetical protein NEFER02_1275 [Nematocida sp. LUAm2]KAI5177697.1 hypothetical protein NEFER01_0921 [Nematocida sp. LUAm1]
MKKRGQKDEASRKRIKEERMIEEIQEEEPVIETPSQAQESASTVFLYRLSILTAALSSFMRLFGSSMTSTNAASQVVSEEQQPERVTSARPEEEVEAQENSSINQTVENISSVFASSLTGNFQTIERELFRNNLDGNMDSNMDILQEDIRRRISELFRVISNRNTSSQNEEDREESIDVLSSQILNPQDVEYLIQQIPQNSQTVDPTNIFFTVVYYYIEEDTPQRKTLDKEDLDKTSPEKEIEKAQGECPICLQGFEEGELSRTLRCKHVFHSSCISDWLIHYADECPMCRASAAPHVENKMEK